MKRSLLSTGIAAATLICAQQAAADSFFEDIKWVPQIGVQWKTLEFDQKLRYPNPDNDLKGSLEADMPTLSLAFTAIYEKGYISFKYEDSLDDTSTNSDVPFTDAETKVDREDFSVTVGYNIWQGANIFLGYMQGETSLEPEPLCPRLNAQTPFPAFCDGFDNTFPSSPLGGNANLAQDHYIGGLAAYEQTYEEDGWYIGASYAWKISKYGTLSISAAYADLEATYEDNYLLGIRDTDFFKFEGDSDGLSYGISWSAPLTSNVGYYFDIRRQSYDMSADESSGNFDGLKVETEETMTAISAGIQWYL